MTKQKIQLQNILSKYYWELVVPMCAKPSSISPNNSTTAGITLEVNENKIIITIDKSALRPDNNISQILVDIPKTAATPRLVVPSAKRRNTDEKNNALLKTFASLCEGLWYHIDVNIDEAKSLLKDAKEGTFLLRNSNHPSFMFTLSIATVKSGVTSIRIGYRDGLFYLDCDDRVRHKMPHFSDVVELIYFYSDRPLSGREEHGSSDDHETTRRIEPHRPKCVWVDAKKRKYLPVQLTVPKLHSLPSLKHACRLRINSCIENKCEELENKGLPASADKFRNQLQIPNVLTDFLQSYPYSI